MKYLLIIHLNPTLMESLSEDDRKAIFGAHDEFQALTKDRVSSSGPPHCRSVEHQDGARCGRCARRHGRTVRRGEGVPRRLLRRRLRNRRARDELAAMLPDARYTAIEVRPVMNAGGEEM